jgi:hypothetical protein
MRELEFQRIFRVYTAICHFGYFSFHKHNLAEVSHHGYAELPKLEEAECVEIEKTYRGKIPMTVCRLTKKGRASFKAYEAALRGALVEPADGTLVHVSALTRKVDVPLR